MSPKSRDDRSLLRAFHLLNIKYLHVMVYLYYLYSYRLTKMAFAVLLQVFCLVNTITKTTEYR